MLHLTAVPEVIEQREMDHIHKGHGRILEFLRERGVRKALNDAFHAFGKFLPEQLFFSLDTGNKNPREVSAEVLQFITNQSIYVEDHIPDFVAYAHSLVGTQKKKSLKVVADPFK